MSDKNKEDRLTWQKGDLIIVKPAEQKPKANR